MSDNMWGYGESSGRLAGADLAGYKVEASDGSIGKVDKHSDEVGSSYIVVDTGPWIFGKEVLLPAGTIERIDAQEEKVYVSRTKEQIKNAPEFDKDKHLGDPGYHEQLGTYYGAGGPYGDHRA
ncbi:PRC-barrel domain-containing protein [Streptomyces sp. H27-H1]|uniref:PRC-barrel domain-containing protein n=1 Tax=Streptomyces sp. H27-H1 TaxID=2996461 RepID=UPI00226D5370|nr:PRC-barrel domain-containing protein [Streptomyces sp. H27-H1]MCY0932255.1 PRC-barrel domain-containing protein [Streptomyces sp. H27-H1]